MAKSTTLPQYLTETLNTERRAQLNTIAAIIVFAYAEQKAERTTDDLGARLHKAAPHKSEKTWQNHVAAARAVIANKAQFIDGAYNDNAEPAQAQAVVLTFLTAELNKGKYAPSVDDITNWAKGRASLKAQALALERAEQEAKKAQAAADKVQKEETPLTPVTDTKAPETTPSSEANDLPQGATGYPPAIQAEAPAESTFLALFGRKADGTIAVQVAENMDRATMVELALVWEQLLAEQFPAPQGQTTDLPVIDPSLVAEPA